MNNAYNGPAERRRSRLLDIKTAAREYGISEWTLRDLIAAGDLPSIRPPRLRRIWIDRQDLKRVLVAWKEHSR